MPKKEFKGRKRDCVGADVVENTETSLVVYLYGHIYPKKNGKRAFRGIVLPSENYCERHKRMLECLGNIDFKFNSFPCSLQMRSLVGDRVKSDCDNQVTSIMDLFTDLGIIPDDNRFIISRLEVENIGYTKNMNVTKVTLAPTNTPIEIVRDFKDTNIREERKSFI